MSGSKILMIKKLNPSISHKISALSAIRPMFRVNGFSQPISNRRAISSVLASENTLTYLASSKSVNSNYRLFSTSQQFLSGELKTVKTPVFPESISEGDIRWVVAVGDSVSTDSVIGEIETDKTTIPVVSPFSGVITKLNFHDGDKVADGETLCELEATESTSVPVPAAATTTTDSKPVSIKTPAFPESITEGDIRISAKIGDIISADDVIGEIETDKTTIEIRSPVAGTILSFNFADGDKVTIDSIVATVAPGAAVSKPVSTVAASKAPSEQKSIPESKPNVAGVGATVTSDISSIGSILANSDRVQTKVKMTRIRQTIAQRLKTAQNTSAMLTTFNEVDMSNLMELRKRYQDQFVKRHNIKLGFMSAFLAASADALQAIPSVNAYIDANEIVYNNYVDISVAVAIPKGLVVPVLKNVQTMNFAQIEHSLVQLSEKAKNNKLAIEDMEGGTFTVSNGGVFGSLMGTPIINPPQSAILGMHAINERPVAINGNVVIRPMMYLALTYDHRIIDGKEAVTFLKRIKQSIEDPRILLLGL